MEGTEVRLKYVEEATKEDILWCHWLAVGTPTHMGIVAWRLKRFFVDVMGDLWGSIDGKLGCAFSSSGGWGLCGPKDGHTANWWKHKREEEREACMRLGERLAQYVVVLYHSGRHWHKARPLGPFVYQHRASTAQAHVGMPMFAT